METAEKQGPIAGVRNVLMVANEEINGAAIDSAVLDRLKGQEVRVMLVAPALVRSGLEHEMGQVDGARAPAQRRLDRSLAELKRIGIEAIGEVGDADPMLAIRDELQKFPADEIILITHTGDDRAYAERDLLAKAHHDFPLPVTEIGVTRPVEEGEAPHLVSVQHEEADPDVVEEALHPADRGFPPLRKRDIAGIIFGLVGSIVLVILAAASALNDPGSGIEGASAAKMLIAIGALLINAAHVVALIFFQSVRYEGIFERFASTFSIVVTSLAIIVSLLI